MAIIGSSILEFEYSINNPPSLVGKLNSGGTATIEVWQDGNLINVTSNICTEINGTGEYTWSIANIPSVTFPQTQYHYRMTDNLGATFDGDFILKTQEGQDGIMPSLNNQSSYIKTI